MEAYRKVVKLLGPSSSNLPALPVAVHVVVRICLDESGVASLEQKSQFSGQQKAVPENRLPILLLAQFLHYRCVCWHAEGLRLVYPFLMQQSAESNWCSWTSFSLLWRAAAVGCSADGVLSATYVWPSLFLIVSTGASVLIICCQLFLRKAMRVPSHIRACSLRAALALE